MSAPCLKPQDSLREQLNKAFVSTSLITLSLVLIVTLSTIFGIANMTDSEATDALVGQLQENMVRTSGDIAATVYKRMGNIAGVVGLVEQALLDRMAGYPTDPRYIDDTFLPFENALDGNARGYPLPQRQTYLDVDLPGAEWDATRFNYYADSSLETSVFWFPGVCDESEEDVTAAGYYENCDATLNNNLTSGGVVSEYGLVGAGVRPDSEGLVSNLADKSAALDHFMRPLYETYEDIFTIGVWFYNEGNCAVRVYPGVSPIPFGSYTPVDCEHVDCVHHGDGDSVVGRDYNCVERSWFQHAVYQRNGVLEDDFVRATDDVIFPGEPYTNAWTPDGVTQWLMAFSKAVYDRITDELIAVVAVEIEMSALVHSILDIDFGDATGSVSLVSADSTGTVFADSNWDMETATETAAITSLDSGISDALWQSICCPDIASEEDWSDVYEYSHAGKDYYLTRFPVPPPPGTIGSDYSSYSEQPNYSPEYYVLVSMAQEDVHEPLETMAKDMNSDVTVLSLVTALLVLLSSVLTVAAVRRVADELCEPLAWMSDIAEKITGNAAGEDLAAGIDNSANHAEADDEIGELVHEFKTMVRGLGGNAAAGAVVAAKQMPPNDLAGDRNGQ